MTVTVYKTSADNRALDKITTATIIGSAIATMDVAHDNDIITPTFIVESDSDLYTANYLYCPTYGRYYYINNISVLTGRRMALKCLVDVLQTYSNDIKNSVATILRAEKIGKPTKYIDNKLPVYPSKKNITSIVLPQKSVPLSTTLSTTDGDNYLLCVVGGSPTL